MLNTGLDAVSPRPQNDEDLTTSQSSLSFSKSSFLAFPFVIFFIISKILLFPILHGVHLPQDSSTINSK